MIKPKKPIAFVCAAALLLSPTGALGASPSDFVDFPNDWSQGAMTAAVENGLLGGVGDGRIAPQGEVTRAQMAAIINRAFGAEKQASLSSYSDVAADAWYAVDMAKAVQMGTFSGTGNGLLEPDRAITREEAFSVLARAFALEAGDDSSLASFSDGAQVSSWAKGSVSAMVAAGYVNGSDGNRLNPQQTITRAEFAAVMSKIVAQYIDADSTLNRSLEIDGNVIVRGNVDLSGYTINGDVIIADEATNVTLDGVTVNGRLVVRGASDSLTINDSSADGVIITNPNGASVLKTDNASDLGTVTALGDLTLSGGQLDRLTIAESATITVEKDASVETITVSADDVTINGAGKVGKVQANADNVHVNVEDAEVTAGKGTSGVTAGDTSVAPGESATVSGDSDNDSENTGSNTGNGGSSGGNNNNPGDSTDTPGTDNPGGSNDNPGTTPGGGESTGDNTNPGGSEETPAAAIINAETTKLVDLGWSQYVTVQFTKGHTLDNTILTIDGTDVTKACTPVTDDGSIVKWEITDLNPAQLVATSAGESQTDTLSKNANPTTPTFVQPENSSADYIIAYGAVPYWDYYLTNYDDEGNVRTEPSKTTFDLSGEEDSDVPAYYSAAAEISSEGTGNVVIQFAYESAEDKAWFDAAAKKGGDVQLVAFNENKNTLNRNLQFTRSIDTSETTSQTVGTITIPLNQGNFFSNGRYYVRITSAGHDTALVPIHVVNKTAPSMELDEPGALKSGKNIHFTVKDMTYGITVPIDSVELSRPDGQTVQLEKIRDWYLIGDSFILYNDVKAENGRNNIPYKGEYTLTVHSTGFKDMTYPFTVTEGEEAPSAASNFGVDALSSASIVGGGSSEGGGGAISAYLKFDVDLLANALLLDEIDMANDAAQGIADRWNYDITAPDTIHTKNGTAYSFSAFRDAIKKEQTSDNKYLTFGEYIMEADKDQTGTPYAIKAVLEDNLLGDIQINGTWVGLTPPALTLVDAEGTAVDAVLEGSDLILTTDDSDYFKALESITINDNALPLDKDDYTISKDGKTLTIPEDNLTLLTLGEANKVVLYADGYKANTLSIRYNKNLENITGLKLNNSSYERGEKVQITVEGSNGDFLKNLTGVTVTLPNNSQQTVLTKSAGGGDYYYTVNGNVLTIVDPNGTLFYENGDYSVSLSAKYYRMQKTDNFQVSGELKPTPQTTITGTVDGDNNLTLNFSKNDSSWRNAITSITVNDSTYTKVENSFSKPGNSEYSWSEHAGGYDGSYDLYLDNQKITDGPNTIVIKSKGYEPLTLTVNISGSSVTVKGDNESTEEPTKQPELGKVTSTVDGDGNVTLAFSNLDNTWQGKITSIKVNDQEYSKFHGSFPIKPGNNQYEWQDSLGYGIDTLYLNKTSFNPGGNTVVISAEGYADLRVTVNITKPAEPPAPAEQEPPTVTESGDDGWDAFELKFDNSEAAKSYLSNGSFSVVVNSTTYAKSEMAILSDDEFYVYAPGNSISLSYSAFSKDGNTTITIKADGYKDLTIIIGKDGNIVK